MSTAVTTQDKGSIMEQVMIKGDLKNLTPEERSMYYMKVCDSVGLNPLTKPFEYIILNGKMTLYALRTCTDQLRSLYKVSVEDLTETEREGVFIVTAKVRDGEGRTDIAKGAVNIKGLSGETLANALMKAETKAKRRATLSICGLGMLDETEVETIPGAQTVVNSAPITPSDVDHSKPKSPFKNAAGRNLFHKNVKQSFESAQSTDELKQILDLNKARFEEMAASGAETDQISLDDLRQAYQIKLKRLVSDAASDNTFDPEEDPMYQDSGLMPKAGIEY